MQNVQQLADDYQRSVRSMKGSIQQTLSASRIALTDALRPKKRSPTCVTAGEEAENGRVRTARSTGAKSDALNSSRVKRRAVDPVHRKSVQKNPLENTSSNCEDDKMRTTDALRDDSSKPDIKDGSATSFFARLRRVSAGHPGEEDIGAGPSRTPDPEFFSHFRHSRVGDSKESPVHADHAFICPGVPGQLEKTKSRARAATGHRECVVPGISSNNEPRSLGSPDLKRFPIPRVGSGIVPGDQGREEEHALGWQGYTSFGGTRKFLGLIDQLCDLEGDRVSTPTGTNTKHVAHGPGARSNTREPTIIHM